MEPEGEAQQALRTQRLSLEFVAEVDEHPQTNGRDLVLPPPQLPPHSTPPSPPRTRDLPPSIGAPRSHDLGFVFGGKRRERERVWLGSGDDRDH
ncbi:hypothetical protein DVH24_015281 [Malus domestica]|uniref:Uncharacterized protein n=1 Tax=Malus domestica TaxID=3750 RepID=A0A498K956_MALDO|nr:hypothetical protein DVH24_015281 [Malus domestica]